MKLWVSLLDNSAFHKILPYTEVKPASQEPPPMTFVELGLCNCGLSRFHIHANIRGGRKSTLTLTEALTMRQALCQVDLSNAPSLNYLKMFYFEKLQIHRKEKRQLNEQRYTHHLDLIVVNILPCWFHPFWGEIFYF